MTPASFPVGNGSVATSTCLIRNYPSVYFGVQPYLCCFPYELVHASGFAGQDVGF